MNKSDDTYRGVRNDESSGRNENESQTPSTTHPYPKAKEASPTADSVQVDDVKDHSLSLSIDGIPDDTVHIDFYKDGRPRIVVHDLNVELTPPDGAEAPTILSVTEEE